jgi:AraC family carnitine catabolism transcriptional activator
LLEGRRVTVPWKTLEAVREAHIGANARDSLFEIDAPFFSCSGGMASMELMLHLIAQHHTVEVANAVAEPFVHSEIRAAGVHQRVAADRRVGISNPNFVRVTRLMEANIETPMNQTTLARRAGLGKRQIERLFARYRDEAP